MSLNESVEAAVFKKKELFRHDFGRFVVRSLLGGAYLTLATAFAVVAGQSVESAAPGHGLGTLVFAALFGIGLFCIVVLNAGLATSNMMYASYGSTTGQVTWGRSILFVVASTFFNLVGAILVAALLGYSAKFNGFDSTHLAATLVEGKLDKGPWQAFVEGIGANFVVNMAIIAGIFAKEIVSKFFAIVPVIAIFVGLGLEHVIANFSLMSLTFFAAGFDPALMPDNFTAGAVGMNWLMVWLGNFVGGGLLIGAVYAYLNESKNEIYRD